MRGHATINTDEHGRDSRHACLAAFYGPLRVLTEPDTRAIEGSLRSLCAGLVVSRQPLSQRPQGQEMRDSLELLHLLWVLDRRAWQRVLDSAALIHIEAMHVLPGDDTQLQRQRCEHDDGDDQTMAAVQEAPHFLLKPSRGHATQTLFKPTDWDFITTTTELSPNAVRVKRELLAAYDVTDLVAFQAQLPPMTLRLQFAILGVPKDTVASCMDSVVQTVSELQRIVQKAACPAPPATVSGADADAHALRSCAPLTLASLDVDLAMCTMNESIAAPLQQLHALGVPFRQLNVRLNQDENPPLAPRRAGLESLLTALLPAQPRRQVTTDSACSSTVDTLIVDRADVDEFVMLCDALAHTDAVRALQLTSIFTFDSAEEREHKWRCLTHALWSQDSSSGVQHLAIREPDFAMADVTAVLMALETTSSGGDPSARCLESLAIACDALASSESIQAITSLLKVIGRELRAFSLYTWMEAIPSPQVSLMLATCTHLRYLDLSNVELDSMDILLQVYESGNCHIEALALHSVTVSESSVTTFIHSLGDDSHPCTLTLRELCLDSIGDECELTAGNLMALLRMLPINAHLDFLQVFATENLEAQFDSEFQAHDGEYLSVVAADSLPMESKLAFLSVACYHSETVRMREDVALQPQRCLPALNDGVLSLIFEWAATPRQRRVHFARAP